MYTEEMLAAMDANQIDEEIISVIGIRYVNGKCISQQATHDLRLALSLFLFGEAPDIASFVRVYFNPHTKGGYVAVDIRGIVEFPFTQLGRDDALAVCRAFLYAYHNQEVSA